MADIVVITNKESAFYGRMGFIKEIKLSVADRIIYYNIQFVENIELILAVSPADVMIIPNTLLETYFWAKDEQYPEDDTIFIDIVGEDGCYRDWFDVLLDFELEYKFIPKELIFDEKTLERKRQERINEVQS